MLRRTVHAGLWLAALASGALAAQTPRATANIYRFILGIDVPESPAFVVIGVAPTHVLRGSAPKPIAVAVLDAFPGGAQAAPGVAVDVAPYFLVGGGVRRVTRWRSMSLGGRLTRVFIKTILSVGAVRDPADPGSALVGLALRSAFHDPHDPLLSSSLPDEVAAELARHGIPDSVATDDDVADRGVDLAPLFARARRALRGRSGDAQMAIGWGLAGRLRGAALSGDSLDPVRHTVWLSGQYTASRRIDILATVQVRSVFRSDARVWLGVGLQRKTTAVDYRAELYYDTRSHDGHPGVAVEARVLPHMGVVAALASQPVDFAGTGPRRLAVRTLLHWFYASDR
jgi:hypothetical protein